jgi:hypothetical protein
MKRGRSGIYVLLGKYGGGENMGRRARIDAPGAIYSASGAKEMGQRLASEKDLLLDVERNA